LEPLRPRLTEIASAKETKRSVRQAALDGLVSLGGGKSVATLAELAGAKSSAEVRQMAAAALAALDVGAASKKAADALASAPADADPSDLINAFLGQKKGVETLASALAGRKLHPDVAKVALRTARASGRDVQPLADALTKAGGLTNPVRVLPPKEM